MSSCIPKCHIIHTLTNTLTNYSIYSPGRDLLQWRGVVVLKSPLDYCIYQLMLQEIKPATIIETGTFNGGTSLWMADLMKFHNVKTHVYTLDIDLTYVNPALKGREDVTIIKGDCNKIEEAFPGDMLKVEWIRRIFIICLQIIHDKMRNRRSELYADVNYD